MRFNAPAAIATVLVPLLLGACGGEKPEASLQAAKASLAKNDGKTAIIQIKNALQANPDLPEARYLLGVALLEAGNASGAEVEFRKAQALKYSPDLVVPKLSAALLAQGQQKKVTDEFATTKLESAAAIADLQTSIALAWAGQNDMNAADAALKEALTANAGFVPALVAQARFKAGRGDLDGAMGVTDDLLKREPKSPEGWKLKGDLRFGSKADPEQALADYRKAVEFKNDYAPAQLAILGILVQQRDVDAAQKQLDLVKKLAGVSGQTMYAEAVIAYVKKDYKTARELAQQLVKLAPNSAPILLLAGNIELQALSFVQAEGYLARAVQLAPQAPVVRQALLLTYLRSGQPEKALTVLHPGQTKDEIPPELYSTAGEVFLQNGDVKSAEEFFAKAAKRDPGDSRKRTTLAMTHVMTGDTTAAFAELQSIAANDKGVSADMALISVFIKRRELDKALGAIDALERKQPDQPLAASLRGRVQMAMKNGAAARKSFERALVIAPTYFPALASLAALDMSEKKPDDAKKRLEAFLEKNPKHAQALLALSELAVLAGGNRDETAALIAQATAASPTDSAPRLLLINLYLRGKDLKQAMTAAQNAAAALPDRPEVLDALGRVQQEAGELNQAIATYNKLAGMQPGSPMPHMRLADIHMVAKNSLAAQESLRKALEINPNLLDVQRNLVSLYVAAGKFPDALSVARTVQRQRPKEAAGFALEGDVNASRRDWDLAITAYRAGLKQVSSSELAVKLHGALLAANKNAEADKFASAWSKEHVNDPVFMFHMADAALLRKDYATAEKIYLDVLKVQPSNAGALNNLAWTASQQNKPSALAYAEKANALAPNQPAYMDTLAMVLGESKEYGKAIALQKQALELQPSNSSFKLALAKLYIKAGDKVSARRELDQLTALGSKFPAQTEVASLLNSL